MSIEEFTDIAYKYFPKGIDNLAEHDRFINSPEIKNLSNHCMSFSDREQKGNFDNFYERIESLDLSKNFHNATLFHWNDRAFNLQLAELKGDKHYSVCLNVSTVVPYYLTYVLETTLIDTKNDPDSLFDFKITTPFRNIEMENHYDDLLQKMASVAEAFFDVKPFSQELIETIIPDLTFETIRPGKFTFFNAFFLDDYHIRL